MIAVRSIVGNGDARRYTRRYPPCSASMPSANAVAASPPIAEASAVTVAPDSVLTEMVIIVPFVAMAGSALAIVSAGPVLSIVTGHGHGFVGVIGTIGGGDGNHLLAIGCAGHRRHAAEYLTFPLAVIAPLPFPYQWCRRQPYQWCRHCQPLPVVSSCRCHCHQCHVAVMPLPLPPLPLSVMPLPFPPVPLSVMPLPLPVHAVVVGSSHHRRA